MRELELVGLSEDKETLVLADDTGAQFGVAADGRLKAALRGDRARLGQLEIEMDSAMRPRDIQARIRAGESAEAVAQVANAPVDRVMAYAVPVLAERSHMAERARRSAVRRKGAEGHGRPLGDYVHERLGSRGINPQSAQWDAWRREDGRWTVSVDYHSGERQRNATFVYDTAGRYASADNDDARWLVGEQSPSHGPQPREPGQSRRLSAVRTEGPVLPLDDEMGVSIDEVDENDSTVDLTEAAAELREIEASGTASEEPGDDMAAIADVISAPDEPDSDKSETGEPAPRRGRSARKDRRRASVPSWDEIMFGRGSNKD